jgi:hypothetical protein
LQSDKGSILTNGGLAMAPQRYVPPDPILKLMLDAGWTRRQIRDHVYAEAGRMLTLAAITHHANRLGYGTTKPRYRETIPWRVKEDHAKTYPIRMLRLLGKRRLGAESNTDDVALLDNWLATLRRNGLIVAYDAADDQGVVYVDEAFRDHDDPSLPIRQRPIHLSSDEPVTDCA